MAVSIHIDSVDHIPRPIIAIGAAYPEGHLIAPHSHRRGQLISSASGVIVLSTSNGAWVMPPQRGLWIPPATVHHVRMAGDVSMQSLYVEHEAVPAMQANCQVVSISPFMRSLMTEALGLPLEYELQGRAGVLMQLIMHEMQQLAVLPLSLPYPSQGALSARCRAFIRQPNIHETTDEWAHALGMSRLRIAAACCGPIRDNRRA